MKDILKTRDGKELDIDMLDNDEDLLLQCTRRTVPSDNFRRSMDISY